MKKKRRFTKVICLILAVLLTGVWIYSNFTIHTVEAELSSKKADEEIRVALISDLHLAFYTDCDKIIEMVSETKPDVIFMLGDMYSRRQTGRIGRVIDFAERLSEIADVYAVTGDHDYDEEYKQKLDSLEKVFLLDYEFRDVNIKGNKLRIYGIDNVYFTDTFDLSNEFETLPNDRINILLSHIPSMPHYGDFGFDYIFCGDTHGGMIRLPILGSIYFNGYIFPEITYHGIVTDKGLYEFGDTNLYVTSGIGHFPIPLRFNCRPEICLIKIKGE